jgi:hypothetical protein
MSYPRRPAPHSVSGSALVLTLLITALLATIVVSFLSTSRIEMMAARNFSRQNAAAGLAELATQQAMAKIQLGFNTTANMTGNYTSVVTTQPGAIHKYFFQNGNITRNCTVEQFAAGNMRINGTATPLSTSISNETVNLNNLSNPRGNATGNLTLTGNAFDQINVRMEEVQDSSGNLVGRVAYYVDDELTKINMNAATGNRTTLNVSTPRSSSLSALTSNTSSLTVTSPQITLFQNVIDGNTSNSSNISNWSHFFRNEQLSANTTFNATAAQLAQISTAPLSDFHLKYTPWGTRRLHINDEPLDKTGVDNVYEALAGVNATTGNVSASPSSYELNGRALRNIYGQTFNDKYGQNWSWSGNMSLTANTTVNGLKQTIANMLQMRAPGHHDKATVQAGYTGPVISENGTETFPPSGYYARVPSGILNEFAIKIDYHTTDMQMYVKPFIEIVCPFDEGYRGATVRVEVTIQSITYTTGNATNTVGPYTLAGNVQLSLYDTNRKCVLNGESTGGAPIDNILVRIIPVPGSIIGNPKVIMGDVKLFTGTSNSSDALRDWLQGDFINQKLGTGGSLTLNTPLNIGTNSTAINNFRKNFNTANVTLQRMDPRITGQTSWVVAPETFSSNGSKIINWSTSNTYTSSAGGHNKTNRPSDTANLDIPGDSSTRGGNEADWYIATERSDSYFLQKLHTLDASNNATFNTPHDLGKVLTNVNWRRLRFMPRHRNENTKNLIPDWAMLDVMSFSSNNSSRSNLKIAPINPNGSFALDTSLNPTIPSPRNNLAALIKPLESSDSTNFKLGSAIARSGVGANMTFPLPKDMSVGAIGQEGSRQPTGGYYDAFRGNAAMLTSNATSLDNKIQNRVWSTLNGTWSGWRTSRGWPATSLILPGEVTEISGVADYGNRSQYNYTLNTSYSIKQNEGRLSAFFPGLTTCSNFFTIYAYAQALDKQGAIDSESLTKTLVEVEITTPATATAPAEYKVKKLYSQNLPMGD